MILYWNMSLFIHIYYTQYSFQKCVAFLWGSSLHDSQQSLWKSMALFKFMYLLEGTLSYVYIYICTAIPFKKGDVSVRKCSVTPLFFHLNKHHVPCRNPSISLKGHYSISSCTLRYHGIPWGQCGMPLCRFPCNRRP